MTWWDSQGFDPQDPSTSAGPGGQPSVDMGYMGGQADYMSGQGNYGTMPVGEPISAGIVPNAGTNPAAPATGQNFTFQQLQDLIGSDFSGQHLQQLLPQLEAAGVEVQNENALTGGRELRPRFRLPSGEVYDFGPGGWVPRGNMPPGFGDATQVPGTGGGGGGGGQSNPGLFNGGSLDELRNTPGYQFALQQGLQGIERGAAAKGTLLSGGTQKAELQYATGLADQTYGAANQRYLDWARLGYPGYPQ